jgi:hypothetical protein
MSQPEQRQTETPAVNERVWQAWVYKNRQRDKAGARRRLRFLQVVLMVTFAAAIFQQLIK